jgi:hypothetical protein
VKERPIILTSNEVRAILARRKTQLRRVVRLPRSIQARGPGKICYTAGGSRFREQREPGDEYDAWPPSALISCGDGTCQPLPCPLGVPGDRLWVRETFYCDDFDYPRGKIAEMVAKLEYRASHDCRTWEAGCPCHDDEGRSSWRSSTAMPRWASRLTLTITSVRVERLQEITEEYAQAEGVESFCERYKGFSADQPLVTGERAGDAPHRASFAVQWDERHGKTDPWASNPWVWCVAFDVVEAGAGR